MQIVLSLGDSFQSVKALDCPWLSGHRRRLSRDRTNLLLAQRLTTPNPRSQCLAKTVLRFDSESSSALQLRKTTPVF